MGTCSTLSETPAVCGTTTHVLTFHLGFYIRIQDGKWSGNYIVFFYANRALKALFLLQASFTQSHSYKCFSFYIQAPHLIFAHTQPLMDTSGATQHVKVRPRILQHVDWSRYWIDDRLYFPGKRPSKYQPLGMLRVVWPRAETVTLRYT